ncbi:unnamed protein product [Larinioides sclopetarius]|uniref:Uncharacterized protein n=1 Tax=Larinioides sclopetarius TaxID=280406 RepID=A0AAV2AZW9_9ARAC
MFIFFLIKLLVKKLYPENGEHIWFQQLRR